MRVWYNIPLRIHARIAKVNSRKDVEVMAILLTVDNRVQEVHPKDGKTFTLDELNGYVGGYIEMPVRTSEWIMVINEEGKLEGLEINAAATFLSGLYPNDYIVGPALLVTPEEAGEDESEDEDEPDDERAFKDEQEEQESAEGDMEADADLEGEQLGDEDAMWDDGGYSPDDYNQEMWSE